MLALLLGALVCVFAAAPAEAQTVTLVTNFAQTKLTGTPVHRRQFVSPGLHDGEQFRGLHAGEHRGDIARRRDPPSRPRPSGPELWSATTGGAPRLQNSGSDNPDGVRWRQTPRCPSERPRAPC